MHKPTDKQYQRQAALIRLLIKELRQAAFDVAEMGCTCADRVTGHEKECSGARRAERYWNAIEKAESAK
jgi:hypothetical protein